MNQDMKREMDELFESLSQGRRPWISPLWRKSSLLPLINVRETRDSYIVTCEVPGMKIENLNIKIEEDALDITGRAKHRRAGRRSELS